MDTRPPSLIVLMFLAALAAIGELCFTAGLPNIAREFHLSPGVTQLTMSLYLFSYACGMLIYGPLANRLGRKKALSIGLGVALLGALLSALAQPVHSFSLLLFARILTALGACSGYMLTFTIVNEYYKEEAKKYMGWFALSMSFLPTASVTIGSFLVGVGGWPLPFYALALLSGILLWGVARLPETLAAIDLDALSPSKILSDYGAVLKLPQIYFYSFAVGAAIASFYCFGATTPFLSIDVLGTSESLFGLLTLIVTVGPVLASILNVKMVHRYTPMQLMGFGLCLFIISILLMLILFSLNLFSIWSLFLPGALMMFGLVFIWSSGVSQAIRWNENKSHASAVMSFFNVMWGFIGVSLIGLLPQEHIFVLPIFLLAIAALIFIDILIIRARKYY